MEIVQLGFPSFSLTSFVIFIYEFQNASWLLTSTGFLTDVIICAVSPKVHPLICPHTSLSMLIRAVMKMPEFRYSLFALSSYRCATKSFV